MRSLKYISVFFIIILMITACNANIDIENEGVETEDDVLQESIPAVGGTLTLSATRFRTLNPIFNRNEDLFQIHHLIYEGLVTFGEDMSIEPLLAQEWEYTNGGQSIDFTIRNGIKWHDGEVVTPEDVIFTFNVIKGNFKDISRVSVYRQSLQPITDIVKIDENTVRVNFSSKAANGLEMMTFPIIPEHIFNGNKIQLLQQDDFIIVGTGQYELKDYENMRNISLIRNENYWGTMPYIDRINVLIIPDEEAQLSLYENGDIDFVSPKIVDWGKYVDERTTNTAEFVTPNYEFMGINFRKNILQDLNIRNAIAYAIDREKIINNIYLGHGTMVDFPIMPNSWLYDNSKIRIGFNQNLARILLDEAGYTLREDNHLVTNDKGEAIQLRLVTNSENPLREQTAILIQEDLQKIGIQLEVDYLDWEELQKVMNTSNYDLFLGGWELSYIPDITSAFHSYSIGSTNFIGYNNEDLDALLNSYLTNGNLSIKKQRFSQVEEHIVTELPYISLFFKNGVILANNKIKGDLKPQSFNVFANIEDWYINVVSQNDK